MLHATPDVDVLIPTYRRPTALAMTLTSLLGQSHPALRIVASDQTEEYDVAADTAVEIAVRVLEANDRPVRVLKHLPRRGLAEHRDFLLSQARAPYALFLDDDVILAPSVISRLVRVIEREGCGFAGNAVIGMSFAQDVRPHEQMIEPWAGRVVPEEVTPDSPAWERWRLHNAANVWHVQRRLGLTDADALAYRVAWVGGCVLYDVAKLRAVGGFGFWRELPAEHAGEDVLAQLRVMRRFGGCGVLPSGAYHQELETTVTDRTVDAPRVLPLDQGNPQRAAREAARD